MNSYQVHLCAKCSTFLWVMLFDRIRIEEWTIHHRFQLNSLKNRSVENEVILLLVYRKTAQRHCRKNLHEVRLHWLKEEIHLNFEVFEENVTKQYKSLRRMCMKSFEKKVTVPYSNYLLENYHFNRFSTYLSNNELLIVQLEFVFCLFTVFQLKT